MRAYEVNQNYSGAKYLPKITDTNFVLSGDKVFHTIQGEGSSVGKQATFIRLHYCNLQCSFCDSWYTWQKNTMEYNTEATEITLENLREEIIKTQPKSTKEFCRLLVFTGGEPLLQQKAILNFLKKYQEFEAEIETNGTIELDNELIKLSQFNNRLKINCSPKLSNSHNFLNIKGLESIKKAKHIFKFVVKDSDDLGEADYFIKQNKLNNEKVYIMPEGTNQEQCMESLQKIIKEAINLGYNITPRFHHDLFKGARAT